MRGGEMGSPQPAAGADFRIFFRAMFIVSWEFAPGGPYLRSCYHALRQPVGTADRALLHN